MRILKGAVIAAVAFGLVATTSVANDLGDSDNIDVEIEVLHFAEIDWSADKLPTLEVDGTGEIVAAESTEAFSVLANDTYTLTAAPDDVLTEGDESAGVAYNGDNVILYSFRLSYEDDGTTTEWLDQSGAGEISWTISEDLSRSFYLKLASDIGRMLEAGYDMPAPGTYEAAINLTVSP